MIDDSGAAAEVIEVVGRTGMHGESTQIKCRLLDGDNKGRIITRNCRGPVKISDVIVLLGTDREVRRLVKR